MKAGNYLSDSPHTHLLSIIPGNENSDKQSSASPEGLLQLVGGTGRRGQKHPAASRDAHGAKRGAAGSQKMCSQTWEVPEAAFCGRKKKTSTADVLLSTWLSLLLKSFLLSSVTSTTIADMRREMQKGLSPVLQKKQFGSFWKWWKGIHP